MKKPHFLESVFEALDWHLGLILLALMLNSLVAIYAAKPFMNRNIAFEFIFLRQVVWFFLGFLVLLFITRMGGTAFVKFSYRMYRWLLGLLVILLVNRLIFWQFFGQDLPFIATINGTTGWFYLPYVGTFQPAEFMKIFLVVIVADIVAQHQKNTESHLNQEVVLLQKVLGKVFLPILLIYLQPETGIIFIFIIAVLGVFLVGEIKQSFIIGLGVMLVLGVVVGLSVILLYPQIAEKFLSPTQLSRVYGWLYPEVYTAHSFQYRYSVISYASSGVWGHGFERYTSFILESHTDFIFSSLVTATGWVGGIMTLAFQLLLDYYFFITIKKTHDLFEKYLLLGFLIMLTYQQFQNIGMILGLLPITGITLPLISYGGSSIISYFIIFGILADVSYRHQRRFTA